MGNTLPVAQKGEKYIQVFEPLEWQRAVLDDMNPVLLLTGTAGGGKSRVAYEKLHALCLYYPGVSIGAFRKKRTDIERSVVISLEKRVIGPDPRVNHRKSDFMFEYDNGSVIFYGGMKDDKAREAIRSMGIDGALDFALMEEGTQFDEKDFDELMARMRGTKAGWTQVIIPTNPDKPGHWINRRLIKGGEASVHYSNYEQNIYNSEVYKVGLSRMKGTTGARLFKGLWIDGEGLVIDTWSDLWTGKRRTDGGGNVTDKADYIPGGGPVVLFADDGYAGEWDEAAQMFTERSHPRVYLLAQLRSDGKIAIFYESYRIKTEAKAHLEEVRKACQDSGWPFPDTAHYDKAAAHLEGVFRDSGLSYLYRGPGSVDESIKELKASCDVDDNGWRRLIVHPRCVLFRLEMSSYAVDENNRPIKAHDNGPDAARYGNWNIIRGPAQPASIAASIPDGNPALAAQIEQAMKRAADTYNRLMGVRV